MAQVVVIGSGVAGLTAAAYMARDGNRVSVFEQFPSIGGVTATLHRQGFSWDLGPMLLEGFGSGEPAADILSELEVYDRVRLIREDRGLSFPGFSLWKPKEYGGPLWRRERLKQIFPEDAGGLDRYYHFYDRIMDLAAYNRRLQKSKGMERLALKARLAVGFLGVRRWKDLSAEQAMSYFFKSKELRALFTAILADFVVPPSRFPALGVPFLNIETAFDTRIPLQVSKAGPRPSYHYVEGGCESLVNALSSVVLAHGGRIHTKSSVTRICIENKRVTGIVINEKHRIDADIVVASGGARETYFGLVGREELPEEFARRIDDVPLMESVHMIHLGVRLDPLKYQPPALCYYYGTLDVEGAITRCIEGDYHEGRDGFVLYVPSLHSPGMAPSGCHAVTIYTIAPNRLSSGDWRTRRRELTDKLLKEAERYMPGLRKNTIAQIVMTPEDFKRRTHLKHHAFGGRAPVMGKKGGPHRSPIQGLWFVGSQSEKEGGGVSGTMEASRKVVEMLRDGEE